MAEREVRSIAYHMKAARFPAYKDLSGFTFAASEINEVPVRQLYRCEFMDAVENVVLIGGPGTGKSLSRLLLAFRPLNIIASACASSRRSNWSMRWNKKRSRAKLERSLRR
jgi:hypothetical protein